MQLLAISHRIRHCDDTFVTTVTFLRCGEVSDFRRVSPRQDSQPDSQQAEPVQPASGGPGRQKVQV